MSSNMEAFLENIFKRYSDKRNETQKKHWFTLSSWVKRACNSEDEFLRLLRKEPEFLNSYKDWLLNDFLRCHNLELSSLREASIYLSSYKDRLAHRSGFLVIIAALFAVLSSIGAAFHTPEWLLANVLTGIALIFERHYLNEKAATTQELIYVIELAQNNANE